MNAIVDAETIAALYDASNAGVQIDLIVRGICCLRPQMPGQSDRIRVMSILGRFLEHSRVWYFANNGKPEFDISSADWMPRNFDRRVECAVPVEDPGLHERLMALLETCLNDHRQAWELAADGAYAQRRPLNEGDLGTHVVLLKDSWGQLREPSIPSGVAPPSAPALAPTG
jgi:polyphosphate kinase